MIHGVYKRLETFKNALFDTDGVTLLLWVDVNHGLYHGLKSKEIRFE